jgi:hypothetical protein
MKGARRRLLFAGVALILAVNAFVLGGVAWNRSGEPDSLLTLSQRELQLPYESAMLGDSSGLSLVLLWRVPAAPKDDGFYDSPMGSYGGSPVWLDADKLRALGFDLPRSADDRRRQAAREVFVVLELAGPAHAAAVAQAQRRVERLERGAAAADDPKAHEQAVKAAQDNLKNEQQRNSRLFAIDAGPDADALRARHADRSRHLIVRGMVRPAVRQQIGDQVTVSGWLESLSIGRMSVPHPLRDVVLGLDRSTAGDAATAFEADVAWGRRHEPWVMAIRVAPVGTP